MHLLNRLLHDIPGFVSFIGSSLYPALSRDLFCMLMAQKLLPGQIPLRS